MFSNKYHSNSQQDEEWDKIIRKRKKKSEQELYNIWIMKFSEDNFSSCSE